MITPHNWVERDPTLKDLVRLHSDISFGMLGYPVLLSADIMAFNAHAVPVGSDQVAHIEITRDIARRFNNIYKNFFVEPEPILNKCSLICGLDGQKMGKSFGNDIKISDTAEVTTKKIMGAVTDPARVRRDDPGNPEQCQVAFKYWQIFGGGELEQLSVECCAGSRGCADCKRQLGEVINAKFAPIRERRRYYEQNPDEVTQIIADGSARARAKAQETLAQVREIIGIYK
jgi:tryptophanyl-tRNA synthetase